MSFVAVGVPVPVMITSMTHRLSQTFELKCSADIYIHDPPELSCLMISVCMPPPTPQWLGELPEPNGTCAGAPWESLPVFSAALAIPERAALIFSAYCSGIR